MPSTGRFHIELAKEDFKFSAAHFTLFGPDAAERLHGHNYRVTVAVEGEELDARGLLRIRRPARGARRCRA
jgi:6-pyruvoyl-tetrahydropterin synthase